MILVRHNAHENPVSRVWKSKLSSDLRPQCQYYQAPSIDTANILSGCVLTFNICPANFISCDSSWNLNHIEKTAIILVRHNAHENPVKKHAKSTMQMKIMWPYIKTIKPLIWYEAFVSIPRTGHIVSGNVRHVHDIFSCNMPPSGKITFR